MQGKHVPPSISATSFSCPHCGALAHQWWHMLFGRRLANNGLPLRPSQAGMKLKTIKAEFDEAAMNVPEKKLEENRRLLEHAHRVYAGELFFDSLFSKHELLPQLANVHASVCYACRKIAVWAGERLVFPPRLAAGVEPNEDLPTDALRDYNEARVILDLSPRGAAALLRLCVQKLCVHLGESGKKIDDDIASLVRKGLDARVQQALDIVRVIGNESVHPGQLDVRDDPDITTKLFGLVNLIAEKMISEPKHVDALYSDLPEAKRKAIEKRDS